ncbi:MAG: hypothetical protein NW201_04680 [Gemmatimonadales bacterium]|nr:hypothetical protein [Gemmatimonadales bacterium]
MTLPLVVSLVTILGVVAGLAPMVGSASHAEAALAVRRQRAELAALSGLVHAHAVVSLDSAMADSGARGTVVTGALPGGAIYTVALARPAGPDAFAMLLAEAESGVAERRLMLAVRLFRGADGRLRLAPLPMRAGVPGGL